MFDVCRAVPEPTRIRVPQFLALIRSATIRGVEARVTPRPRSLELELLIEGRLYCIGANVIRAHYADPPVGEVRNGWVHRTLTLEELLRQRVEEMRVAGQRWAEDLRAAREGSAAGA